MVILFTGFEPFGKWSVNPTAEAVKELDGTIIGGTEIIGREISLRYYEIRSQLMYLVDLFDPSVIILSGQAGGREIRLEKIAHNIVDNRVPYNCGTTIEKQEIIDGGFEKLPGSLPYDKILQDLKQASIPATLSADAGKFGCNQIFYLARYLYADIPSGFIHVPLLPSQAEDNNPHMSQEMITTGFKRIFKTITESLNID